MPAMILVFRLVLSLGAGWSVMVAGATLAAEDKPTPREMTIAEFARWFTEIEDTAPSREVIRLRGRITWTKPEVTDFVAEDDSIGVTVHVDSSSMIRARSPEISPSLVLGTEVVVDGVVDGRFAVPAITATEVEVLCHGDLPPAPQADLVRLWTGADLQRRMVIEGIVQSTRDEATAPEGLGKNLWQLRVLCTSRHVTVFLHKSIWPEDPRPLIDATVRITGVTGPFRNTKGEFLGPWFNVARPQDVEVIEPPPPDPFGGEFRPLRRLRTYRSEPSSGHRIRTRGTVTLASPTDGFFVIQEGLAGAHVRIGSGAVPAVGDRVEVAGFIDMARNVSALSGAAVRPLGRGTVPAAVEIAPDEIMRINAAARKAGIIARPSSYEGCRVRFRGRVIEAASVAGGPKPLLLASDKSLVDVSLPGPDAPVLARVAAGADVQVTGVVQLVFAADEGPTFPDLPSRLSLLAASAADVVVLRKPSWWTADRLTAALAAVAVALAIATGWSAMLRRQVARQSRRLAAEITARERAHIEFEAALHERTRLAANLHDTVLQTVTGIGYQLKACRHTHLQGPTAELPEADRIVVAQRMVEHAVDQLRGTLWAMRSPPLDGRSFTTHLHSMAMRLAEGHSTRIVVHVDGVERRIEEDLAGNLLLIAQEAVVNSVRHAAATVIDIIAVFEDASVGVVIQDDGRGFDTSVRADSAGRHFGIDGMVERMTRLGGTLAVESRPGGGTIVTAVVPDAKAPLGAV